MKTPPTGVRESWAIVRAMLDGKQAPEFVYFHVKELRCTSCGIPVKTAEAKCENCLAPLCGVCAEEDLEHCSSCMYKLKEGGQWPPA